jgi:hypothetical protein
MVQRSVRVVEAEKRRRRRRRRFQQQLFRKKRDNRFYNQRFFCWHRQQLDSFPSAEHSCCKHNHQQALNVDKLSDTFRQRGQFGSRCFHLRTQSLGDGGKGTYGQSVLSLLHSDARLHLFVCS